jgi:GT2 family glycosyltransferase
MAEQPVVAQQGVSVVVPTLNRGNVLLDCLTDLVAQRHRPLEILVVDQSPAMLPGVAAIVEQHPDLISYHQVAFRGLPRARNYGWQQARYEAIVYVDDDIRCGPEFVTEHLKALRASDVGVVGGGIDEAHKPPDIAHPVGGFSRWTAIATRGFAARGQCEINHAPGGNFSIWRKVVRSVGGFDEALSVGAALCEELEFCLRVRRAGYRIYFNGAARMTHLAAANGGCRVANAHENVYALTHNQALVIRRHLGWVEMPVAVFRLGLIGLAFAWHHRMPSLLADTVRGCWAGLGDGGRSPRCTWVAQELRCRQEDAAPGPLADR